MSRRPTISVSISKLVLAIGFIGLSTPAFGENACKILFGSGFAYSLDYKLNLHEVSQNRRAELRREAERFQAEIMHIQAMVIRAISTIREYPGAHHSEFVSTFFMNQHSVFALAKEAGILKAETNIWALTISSLKDVEKHMMEQGKIITKILSNRFALKVAEAMLPRFNSLEEMRDHPLIDSGGRRLIIELLELKKDWNSEEITHIRDIILRGVTSVAMSRHTSADQSTIFAVATASTALSSEAARIMVQFSVDPNTPIKSGEHASLAQFGVTNIPKLVYEGTVIFSPQNLFETPHNHAITKILERNNNPYGVEMTQRNIDRGFSGAELQNYLKEFSTTSGLPEAVKFTPEWFFTNHDVYGPIDPIGFF